MKFSRLMPRSDNGASLRKGFGTSIPESLSDHHSVDHAVELIQVATLFDHVAMRQVAIHLAVAESPRHTVLGIEPDELLRALADLLQNPFVRQVVVVPRVAEDDHGGVTRDRGQVL